MAIVIPEQEISETFGVIQKACNTSVMDSMNALAAVMLPMQGESAIVDEAIANCKKVQGLYNDGGFVDSLRKLLNDFTELDAIREYMEKKASVGNIESVDTGFNSGNIDASAVTM